MGEDSKKKLNIFLNIASTSYMVKFLHDHVSALRIKNRNGEKLLMSDSTKIHVEFKNY